MQTVIKTICVFCSSVNIEGGIKLANELADLFLHYNLRFVFGGGDMGLMGQVAIAMSERNVPVLGFLPNYFKEIASQPYGHIVYASDFHTQLSLFDENCDAFIALPGGIGTLSEIIHVLKSNSYNLHHKPLAVLNYKNCYDHIINWLEESIKSGWVSPHTMENLIIEDNIQDLMHKLLKE